jgi:hypothetical protein
LDKTENPTVIYAVFQLSAACEVCKYFVQRKNPVAGRERERLWKGISVQNICYSLREMEKQAGECRKLLPSRKPHQALRKSLENSFHLLSSLSEKGQIFTLFLSICPLFSHISLLLPQPAESMKQLIQKKSKKDLPINSRLVLREI